MKRLLYAICSIFVVSGLVWAATTYTTNYSLSKPGVGDRNWGEAVNTNFDTIDTQLKATDDSVGEALSDSTWTLHNNYPTACSAGKFVSGLGDTLTCGSPGGMADYSFSTWDMPSGADIVADDSSDTVRFISSDDSILIIGNGTTDTIDLTVVGGFSPGGNDTYVQYNDGGSFGGDSGFVFNEASDDVIIGGSLILSSTDNYDGYINMGGSNVMHVQGINNLFLGQGSGNKTMTSAIKNYSLGGNSLTSLTTGDNNIAIGYTTMPSLKTGSGNVAIGDDAMFSANYSNYNVAVGSSALYAMEDATGNVAIGDSALIEMISGNYNIGIGYLAGDSLTSGSENVLIGLAAGGELTTTGKNIAIGSYALTDVIDSSYDNIAIGYFAGDNLAENASGIILIGSKSDVVSNLGNNKRNSIVFGKDARFTESNQLILGNTGIEEVGINSYDPKALFWVAPDDSNDYAFLPAGNSAPIDGDFTESQWVMWLDEVNDQFELKAKKANGDIITQTVGAGGSSAVTSAFKIITGDNGLTIVADGTDDVINFTSSDDSITIVTNTTTDTIDLKAVGGVVAPGGNDTELQYNNGGALNGISTVTTSGTNFVTSDATVTFSITAGDSDLLTLNNAGTGYGLKLTQSGVATSSNALYVASSVAQTQNVLAKFVQYEDSTMTDVEIDNNGVSSALWVHQDGTLTSSEAAVYITATGVQTAGNVLYVQQSHVGSTADVFKIVNNGIGDSITMTGFKVSDDGTTTVNSLVANGGSGNILTNATINGIVDIGGATSLEIPWGENPTVDIPGEFALDITDNQLVYYSNAKTIVMSPVRPICASVENLAAADDNMPFYIFEDAHTLSNGFCRCVGTCTTPATITFEIMESGTSDVDAVAGTITCQKNTETVKYTLSADNTAGAYSMVRFDVTNAVSPETDKYIICLDATMDRQ